MEESGYTKQYTRRRVLQAVSIPFLWEERPGTPKKDWKPEISHPVSLLPATPVEPKLIASVPFEWEEKLGMQLICFSPSNTETKLISLGSSENLHAHASSDEEMIITPDLEVVPAAPSFLDIPSSPSSDTDGSTSSYVTGCSSPVGSSFLECLFPLYQPDASILERVESSKKGPINQQELMDDEFDHRSSTSLVVRRTPTLGELIMMSRRMSYQRKAIQVRKQHVSMKLVQKGALGCCFFGTDTNTIGGLHRNEEREPRLCLF